jgi:hypothetical protein
MRRRRRWFNRNRGEAHCEAKYSKGGQDQLDLNLDLNKIASILQKVVIELAIATRSSGKCGTPSAIT